MPRVVARIDECSQILAGCRREVALGIPKLIVGRQVVGGAVAPLARVNAVGRRQHLHSIHAKLHEIRRIEARHGQFGEIRPFEARLDQGTCVAECSDSTLELVAAAGARPSRRQFVDHQPIIGRQRIEVRNLALGRFAIRVPNDKPATGKPDHRCGMDQRGVVGRIQPVIHNGRERVGCLNAAQCRLATCLRPRTSSDTSDHRSDPACWRPVRTIRRRPRRPAAAAPCAQAVLNLGGLPF